MRTLDMTVSAPIQSPENVTNPNQMMYPLFEAMLRSMGLTLKPTYTCQDLASLFGVTARTVQSKVADGTIPSRRLLGGARFLPADVEEYLRKSAETPPR
jgi:excisionase family DNA binding protein